MAVAFGDILRVTVAASNNNLNAVQNVYYMKYVGVGSLTEAEALDDVIELLEALHALIAAILSTVYIIQNIRAINFTAGTDVGIDVPADTTPGSNASTRYPPQMSMVLNLFTPFLNARGRKYYGSVPADMADANGLVVAGVLTALGNAGTFLIADQVATNGTWEFGIPTLTHGWQQFTGFGVSARLGVQRRRKIGVGI